MVVMPLSLAIMLITMLCFWLYYRQYRQLLSHKRQKIFDKKARWIVIAFMFIGAFLYV